MDYGSNSSEMIGDSASGELSEIYVSPDASDDGNGSSQNPYKCLECAINNSKEDSTIYLNDGKYVGENNRNINIDKSITIIGKSKEKTIINAESSGRLFNVTSARLTLINVTLTNGHTAENGGLIYCDGGAINIKNCILKGSSADSNGGVIYNNMGSLTIEDSSFMSNRAHFYGGVLYTLGVTSIKNSNFTGNSLTYQDAVGACIAAGGKLDVDGCLFTNCHSPYSAAAILNIGNATINNCRFEKLTTDYTAGAISNHNYMVINNSYFGYNEVRYYAGAILAPPSGHHVITEVYNTIFEKNHASYHAAVSNNFVDTELYMKNCAIVGNYITPNARYGDIALDDNATIIYCWWGQNEISPYYYSPYNDEWYPEKINASRWLVMTFTSEDDVIYRDEINQLTVSLKHYFDNETKEIYDYDEEFDLPLEVTFFTDAGFTATKKLVNGVATLDFNPQEGDSVIYARVNNQTLKLDSFQSRKTSIEADDFETCYGSGEELLITLVKDNNVPVSNANLTVYMDEIPYAIKTDENGQAKLPVSDLVPDTYTAAIVFEGNGNYSNSTKSVNVIIKKATPKLTAVKKAFKKSVKTKKYKIALKTNMNKAMKNTKVLLKVNGKKYSAKTNSKGKATFKITKLNKKGTFAAVVKYAGSKYYAAKKVKSKIVVK